MDSKELHNLHEAYLDVYELDEVSQQLKTRAFKNRATREFESDGDNPKNFTKSGASKADQTKANIVKKHGNVAGQHAERAAHAEIFGRKSSSMPKKPKKPVKEGFDFYDIILSHLIAEGYADTEQAAEAIIVNMSEEWREEILDEAITSEKGEAKAAEMIADRTTLSGKAKPGKGANVAQIRQIGRSNREGLGGTPMTPTMAKNPVKKQNYDGTGNKAARRAGTYKESFNIFVNSMIAEGVSMERYTWEEIQNVFDDLFEAQVANRDPDEYERKAKQGQSREQQLKGRVMGRMNQMDPDKKAAMLKQMRAAGLDV
jgi:hypothetical protein